METDWQRQVIAARGSDIGRVARDRVPGLWKTSEGLEGPCPRCGGHDRFSVNVRKRVFNCRGAAGDDVIGMVQHISGCSFRDAVQSLVDQSSRFNSKVQPVRRSMAPPPRHGLAYGRTPSEKDGTQQRAELLFEGAEDIAGTWAGRYLENRGLVIYPRWTFDLRFAPRLAYWGFPGTGANEAEHLGEFPALLAAIRSPEGNLIGVHRTYLDKYTPVKLNPPGDARRNAPKKILGRASGGLVRLSPIEPVMAIGEGIETSQSWYALARTTTEVGVAAAISLGNLAGAAERTSRPRMEGGQAYDPDMARPGMILPCSVEEVILLQDGDSDPDATIARMVCALRRFERQGISASIDEAPIGRDFNDVLREGMLEA